MVTMIHISCSPVAQKCERSSVDAWQVQDVRLSHPMPVMQDVAAKLGLASVKDTESVVAKTIRDGSIAAVLDHDHQILMSRSVTDVYVTKEPQEAFHARTAFCMDIHNEAVKAMRYDTPDADKAPKKADLTAGLTEAIAAALAEDEGF
jgi:26S proteasome regulatory subunit N3